MIRNIYSAQNVEAVSLAHYFQRLSSHLRRSDHTQDS